MTYIEKKGDSGTRLNFRYAYLPSKTTPESNVSLNRTIGGTPITIEQGVKISKALIQAIIPREDTSQYVKDSKDATYDRLLNFFDNVVNWSELDIDIYIDTDTPTPVTCRFLGQSLPKRESGAFFYDMSLEFDFVRIP